MEHHSCAPIKLTILLQDLEFGGTQRYAINLLKHLDRRRFSTELWVLRGGADMIPLAKESGAKIKWLSKSSSVGPHSVLRLYWTLIRQRPQILYTLTVVPNIWGRIFGKIAGTPVIISGYRSCLPKQHERWLWRLSNRIICNAEALREEMVRRFSVDPDRIAVIPNGVDTDVFYPCPGRESPDPSILCVCRLVKEKAPFSLLEAFSLAAKTHPTARLQIIGNGPLRKRLEARIRSLSLESRVQVLPGARDIPSFLRKAWIFALASDHEASPNVIIEAMASGLPVVATRVGGIPELIENGKSGVMVEPGDPEGMSSALMNLLENGSQRRAMGLRAREKVLSNHSLCSRLRQTEDILEGAFRERALC